MVFSESEDSGAVTTLNSERGLRAFRAKAGDRWLPWLMVISGAMALSFAVLSGMPGLVSFLLIPTSGLIVPLVGLAACGVVMALLINWLPQRAISVVAALSTPLLQGSPILWTSECLHTLVTVTTGAGQIGCYSLRGGGEAYDRSAGFAGGSNTFLIHDCTDQISSTHTPSRTESAANEDLRDACAGKFRHLIGHYFICVF